MSKRVLFVDDSKTMRKAGEISVRFNNNVYLSLENGNDIVEFTLKEKPDIIFLDAKLPDNSGYKICYSLKTNPQTKHIPVVLMVSKFNPYDEEKGKKVGVDKVIEKPFDTQEIRDTIESSNLITVTQIEEEEITDVGIHRAKEVTHEENSVIEINENIEEFNLPEELIEISDVNDLLTSENTSENWTVSEVTPTDLDDISEQPVSINSIEDILTTEIKNSTNEEQHEEIEQSIGNTQEETININLIDELLDQGTKEEEIKTEEIEKEAATDFIEEEIESITSVESLFEELTEINDFSETETVSEETNEESFEENKEDLTYQEDEIKEEIIEETTEEPVMDSFEHEEISDTFEVQSIDDLVGEFSENTEQENNSVDLDAVEEILEPKLSQKDDDFDEFNNNNNQDLQIENVTEYAKDEEDYFKLNTKPVIEEEYEFKDESVEDLKFEESFITPETVEEVVKEVEEEKNEISKSEEINEFNTDEYYDETNELIENNSKFDEFTDEKTPQPNNDTDDEKTIEIEDKDDDFKDFDNVVETKEEKVEVNHFEEEEITEETVKEDSKVLGSALSEEVEKTTEFMKETAEDGDNIEVSATMDSFTDEMPTSDYIPPQQEKTKTENTERFVKMEKEIIEEQVTIKLNDEHIKQVITEIVKRISREVIEEIVWSVVPEMAETIIKEELDKMLNDKLDK